MPCKIIHIIAYVTHKDTNSLYSPYTWACVARDVTDLKIPSTRSTHVLHVHSAKRREGRLRFLPFASSSAGINERNGPRAEVERRGLCKLLLWLYNVTSALQFDDPQSELPSSRWGPGVVAWMGITSSGVSSSSFASWNLEDTKFALCCASYRLCPSDRQKTNYSIVTRRFWSI